MQPLLNKHRKITQELVKGFYCQTCCNSGRLINKSRLSEHIFDRMQRQDEILDRYHKVWSNFRADLPMARWLLDFVGWLFVSHCAVRWGDFMSKGVRKVVQRSYYDNNYHQLLQLITTMTIVVIMTCVILCACFRLKPVWNQEVYWFHLCYTRSMCFCWLP